MKTVKIALLNLGLVSLSLNAGLFNKTSKTQTQTIECYKDVNINVVAIEGSTVQILTGDCYIEGGDMVMGASGDIIQFADADLPFAITLGQVAPNTIATRDNLKTPAKDQKVLFQFNTSAGEIQGASIEFLVERVADRNKLDKEIQARRLEPLAERLRANNPGQQLDLFVFYRKLPGITAGWFDLGQILATSSSVSPEFNIAVDDSGKVMIDSSSSEGMQLFDLGQFSFQRSDPKAVTSQQVSEHFKDLLQFKRSKQ